MFTKYKEISLLTISSDVILYRLKVQISKWLKNQRLNPDWIPCKKYSRWEIEKISRTYGLHGPYLFCAVSNMKLMFGIFMLCSFTQSRNGILYRVVLFIFLAWPLYRLLTMHNVFARMFILKYFFGPLEYIEYKVISKINNHFIP